MGKDSERKISIELPCISLGSMIAVAVSWSVNGSILWAILHGICGWFYVVYYLLT